MILSLVKNYINKKKNMIPEKKQNIQQFIIKSFAFVLLIWTCILGFSLWFNINDQQNKTVDVVKKIARSNFNKDQAYRVWASSHGGVYVTPSKKTPPSPWMSHIKDRDLITTTGKKLTLMNPAYMLREMMNDYSDLYGIKGRIAGIKYLNINNKATKNEAKIIRRFDKGEKEVSEIQGFGDEESFFLARPMIMQQACQKCHGHLGFKNGSVRGSVSISVPMLPYRDIEFKLVESITITHILVWLIGFISLVFISKKARKILEEKEKHLDEIKISSFVFEDTIDAILITNNQGKIIRINDAFTKLTGYSFDEVQGKDPNILKSELHDIKFYEKLWASILTDGSWKGEIQNKKKNNEVFISYQSISTVKDDHGNIKYMTSILHDITERKGYEKQIEDFNKDLQEKVKERTSELEESNDELEQTVNNLKETQKRLVESEKLASLGGLVAGVAHEINTPVGVGITGITHFLEVTENVKKEYENNNLSEDVFKKYLDTSEELANLINTNLQRTAHLVKSFKQISSDQTSEEKREFYFKEYIEEILLSISNIIKRTQIKINIKCDEKLKINSYPGLFSQIITNLIINSINHAYKEREEGTILIEVIQKGNHLTLIYKDNGKGVSQKDLKKIFEPFFTTNRKGGGTGLGLNIIHNIITSNLKGEIVCHSQEGKGIEFVITFSV